MALVTCVSGDTTSDGRRVRLQVIVDDDEISELVLSRDDVQPFVTLLIALGGQALDRSGTPAEPPVFRARPFPVDAVTLHDVGHLCRLASRDHRAPAAREDRLRELAAEACREAGDEPDRIR